MTLKLFPYINKLLQKEPVFLDQGDRFDVDYLLYYQGIMNFTEYMNFLHNAMKMDSFIHSDEFSGGWKKFNDYHVYRKSIFNS
mmetsp:Transcript_20377/g.3313  ORF Transcript_20377/g.3313 Transcript_20377/m.3313 type:complete len:83 (-) Transcript_20377:19-267(-)